MVTHTLLRVYVNYVMSYFAHVYTVDTHIQIKMAAAVFCAFDKDGSGYLTPQELCEALESLGCDVTMDRAESLLSIIDSNNDGKVQLCEFEQILYILQHADLACDESILFYASDIDQSGSIGPHELHGILTKIGINCSQRRVEKLVDRICNGELSYVEFMRLMTITRQCLRLYIANQMASSTTHEHA